VEIGKRGKEMAKQILGKVPTILVVGALIFVMVACIAVIYAVVSETLNPATGTVINTGTSTGTGQIVLSPSTAASLTVTPVDAANTATGVGGNIIYNTDLNPVYAALTSGTTTVDQGRTINLLVGNGTTYHNCSLTGYKIASMDKSLQISPMCNKNATVSLTGADTGAAVATSLTNGGGANNATSTGGSNIRIGLKGTQYQNTQDMTCIYEMSNKSAMDSANVGISVSGTGFVMSNLKPGNPLTYTTNNTNSVTWQFDVTPLTDSSSKYIDIVTPSKVSTSNPFTGMFGKLTCKTKEYFKDDGQGTDASGKKTIGTIIYGTENSDGTISKSLGVYTFQWYY
jgi:hypothetical protein